MQNQFQYQEIINLVHETKKIADDRALRSKIQSKGTCDYVTAVDLTISSFLKTRLKELYPDIGFMSEEEENCQYEQDRWILDPIDGTTNLVFDYRLSSVSLALLRQKQIVFGIVYNPFTDETFVAERGKGAYLNENRLHVSEHTISESLIEFSAGARRKEDAEESFCLAKEIFKDCIDVRHICSSALSISYIAAKRIDGFFEKILNPWDYAAASLILQEAGGLITDWKGNPLQFDCPSTVIASNQKNIKYLLLKINGILNEKEVLKNAENDYAG